MGHELQLRESRSIWLESTTLYLLLRIFIVLFKGTQTEKFDDPLPAFATRETILVGTTRNHQSTLTSQLIEVKTKGSIRKDRLIGSSTIEVR